MLKNRITVRKGRHAKPATRQVVTRRIVMGGLVALATVATTVGVTTAALEPTAVEAQAAPRRVTPVGDLPPEASVSRSTKAPGVLMAEVRAHQKRVKARKAAQAAQAVRLARKRAARAAARAAARDPRGVARSLAASRYGWGAGQFGCLSLLWDRESGWNPHAANPSSGAYGIPQALPGSKMATKGADWRTNPVTQIAWGLSYVKGSYGSPCGAWAHSQSNGWY